MAEQEEERHVRVNGKTCKCDGCAGLRQSQ
jgi:hypothetical protein